MAIPVAVVAGLVASRLTTEQQVRIPEPPSTAESRQLCSALTWSLPKRLGPLPARQVDGNTQVSAAWGDPPVILQCGLIAAPTPVGQLVTLDGVDWAPVTDKTVVTWTTIGRKATVRVVVPRKYDNQAPLLAHLSPAISRAVPKAS